MEIFGGTYMRHWFSPSLVPRGHLKTVKLSLFGQLKLKQQRSFYICLKQFAAFFKPMLFEKWRAKIMVSIEK
jgi:hypothetical protein